MIAKMSRGWERWFARRYGEAEPLIRRALELGDRFFPALLWLGLTLTGLGRYDEAAASIERGLDVAGRQPEALAALGIAHARAGRAEDARRLLAEIEAAGRARYVPSIERAYLLAALGERDAAFEALERALVDRDAWMVLLPRDPRADVLRDDPRLSDLARRAGLALPDPASPS